MLPLRDSEGGSWLNNTICLITIQSNENDLNLKLHYSTGLDNSFFMLGQLCRLCWSKQSTKITNKCVKYWGKNPYFSPVTTTWTDILFSEYLWLENWTCWIIMIPHLFWGSLLLFLQLSLWNFVSHLSSLRWPWLIILAHLHSPSPLLLPPSDTLCVRACVRACMDMWVHVSVHMCMHAFVHVCVHACMHACVSGCVFQTIHNEVAYM